MITKNEEKSFKAINKVLKSYVKDIDNSSLSKVEEDQISYVNFFDNKMLIIQAIRQGFPYKLFNKIMEITPFTEDDWASYLNISKKTLARHSNEENYYFKPIHTEKIIELAEVTNYGKEVFDSTEQFYLWLKTPCLALGNLNPAELLKDSYGKELVMNELNKIEHGIFA